MSMSQSKIASAKYMYVMLRDVMSDEFNQRLMNCLTYIPHRDNR